MKPFQNGDLYFDKFSPRRLDYMKRFFKKRQNIFITHISNQAKLTLEGLDALNTYMATQDTAASDLLAEKEKAADEARRILIDDLNRTFVTPFDREDIFAFTARLCQLILTCRRRSIR